MSETETDAVAALRLYEQGCLRRKAGDLAGAEHSFSAALDIKHDFAQAHLALGEALTSAGRTEDAVDCFQMALHFSPQLVDAHVALAAALTGLKRLNEAEAACRSALGINDNSAPAWFWLGSVLKARGDLEGAADAYSRAAAGEPADINALQQLAFVEYRLGRYENAQRDFLSLLKVAGNSPNAHHNFGLLQLETGFPAEALASFQRALELNPGAPETMSCIAHALRDLGRLDEAIGAYDQVLAKVPTFGDALANRSLAMLMRGDYTEGWRQYEKRFIASATHPRSLGAAAWQGEPLAGRSIAVLSEQGVGDEIMFASCVDDLISVAGQVIVECEPRLVALFGRSFCGATVRARGGAAGAHDSARQVPDFEISFGSLPLHFRRGAERFPNIRGYLRADPMRVSEWKKRYAAEGDVRRVGIAWRGGTLRNRRYLRSLELEGLGELLRLPGCAFYSLQSGDCQSELLHVSARSAVKLRDVAGAAGEDMDELAAAIEALDLVITVDNTIAHLSGALGKPTWVLLPYSCEWRYGRSGESMAWYPSMKLLRQNAPREWAPVIGRAVRWLAKGG